MSETKFVGRRELESKSPFSFEAAEKRNRIRAMNANEAFDDVPGVVDLNMYVLIISGGELEPTADMVS